MNGEGKRLKKDSLLAAVGSKQFFIQLLNQQFISLQILPLFFNVLSFNILRFVKPLKNPTHLVREIQKRKIQQKNWGNTSSSIKESSGLRESFLTYFLTEQNSLQPYSITSTSINFTFLSIPIVSFEYSQQQLLNRSFYLTPYLLLKRSTDAFFAKYTWRFSILAWGLKLSYRLIDLIDRSYHLDRTRNYYSPLTKSDYPIQLLTHRLVRSVLFSQHVQLDDIQELHSSYICQGLNKSEQIQSCRLYL
ncbi:hypothetical protein ABPG73_013834 [Tetrahymena malaccensis]